MIPKTAVFAVLAALVLAVAGCGGSKKTSDSAAATTPATTTSTSSSSSTDTTGSSSSSDTTGSSSSSDTTGNNVAARCVAFAGVASKLSQALGAGGSGDTEATKKYFEALADKAPSEIKASFKTFADAFAKYLDTLKSLNFKPGDQPSAADAAKLQQAAQGLSTPEVQAASEKIRKWVDAGCK